VTAIRALVLLVSLAAATALAQVQGPQPTLPTMRLQAGMHLITAEVAADGPSRTIGLMFRAQLKPNHGMLFVFDERSIQCMWMRNTLIALSVAFLDDDGTIVNIEQMQPKTETSHCAKRPVRLALEMDHGWFAQRGLTAGSMIRGLPAPAR
jgi:uncharacterized membrane protein (UPF0127 family)